MGFQRALRQLIPILVIGWMLMFVFSLTSQAGPPSFMRQIVLELARLTMSVLGVAIFVVGTIIITGIGGTMPKKRKRPAVPPRQPTAAVNSAKAYNLGLVTHDEVRIANPPPKPPVVHMPGLGPRSHGTSSRAASNKKRSDR